MTDIQHTQKAIAELHAAISVAQNCLAQLESSALMLRVCSHFSISVEELLSPLRDRKLVDARCIYASMRRDQGTLLLSIASEIHRNHSTVIALLQRFTDYINIYDDFKAHYYAICESKY
jgi:chromosomal replication initiation ATPase DnaA